MLNALNDTFTRFTNHPDFGKLLLRLTFGLLMLFHGVAKVNMALTGFTTCLKPKVCLVLSLMVFLLVK